VAKDLLLPRPHKTPEIIAELAPKIYELTSRYLTSELNILKNDKPVALYFDRGQLFFKQKKPPEGGFLYLSRRYLNI